MTGMRKLILIFDGFLQQIRILFAGRQSSPHFARPAQSLQPAEQCDKFCPCPHRLH